MVSWDLLGFLLTFPPFPTALLPAPLPGFKRSDSRGHEQAHVQSDPTMAKAVLCDLPASAPVGRAPQPPYSGPSGAQHRFGHLSGPRQKCCGFRLFVEPFGTLETQGETLSSVSFPGCPRSSCWAHLQGQPICVQFPLRPACLVWLTALPSLAPIHIRPQLRPQCVLFKFWPPGNHHGPLERDHIGVCGPGSGCWLHPGAGVALWQALFPLL